MVGVGSDSKAEETAIPQAVARKSPEQQAVATVATAAEVSDGAETRRRRKWLSVWARGGRWLNCRDVAINAGFDAVGEHRNRLECGGELGLVDVPVCREVGLGRPQRGEMDHPAALPA